MNLSGTLAKLVAATRGLGEHPLSRKPSAAAAAVSAFALGLAAWGLLAPAAPPACGAPLVVEVRNETGRGKYDTVAYETCRGEAGAGGRYENERYSFSVGTAPAASGAVLLPPPAPHVDASHNPLDWRQLDDAVHDHVRNLRVGGNNVRVLSKTTTSLGGLPAARVVTAYEKGGAAMVSDQIIAFRRAGGAGGAAAAVVYTIDLSTTLDNYERDRPVLEAMRQTWHLQTPR